MVDSELADLRPLSFAYRLGPTGLATELGGIIRAGQ